MPATRSDEAGGGRLARLRGWLWPDRPAWRRPGVWLVALVVAGVAAVGTVAVAFAAVWSGARIPPPSALRPAEPTVVLDAAGERAATLEPGAIRENVQLESLPDHVWEATLAAEDQRFFAHPGFSVPAILRSAWVNLTAWELRQGASTITQQYVDMAVEDVRNTLAGKFREVVIATKLDRQVDKRTILQMYLNTVPYGRGAMGIEAAAQTYYQTPAASLSVNQAATLAGMVRAPSALDPVQNSAAARARRNEVLEAMATQGWLADRRAARLQDRGLPRVTGRPPVNFGANGYFLEAVRSRAASLVDDEHGDPSTGLVIETTLHQGWQQTAVGTLREHVGDTPYSGAVVTIDAASGAVRALVGGLDYDRERFNVATEGRRGPGSSFKPYVLSAFVESGGAPSSLVQAPAVVAVTGDEGDRELIENYSGHGWGIVEARTATERSINTAYVNLGLEVGLNEVVTTAEDMGLSRRLPAYPATMLGAGGVSPLDHAGAYGTLAAGGTRHEPFLIRTIRARDTGRVLHRHEPAPRQVLAPDTAAVVSDVLRGVVTTGTGGAADIPRPVAGKTGTTSNFRDAWFVGYTPRTVTSVWVGNRERSEPMAGVTGGSIPARTWGDYMARILEGRPVHEFPEPEPARLEERFVDGEPGTERLDEVIEDDPPGPGVPPSPPGTPTAPAEE